MKYFVKIGERNFEFRFERKDGALLVHTEQGCRRIETSLVADGRGLSMLVDGCSHDVLMERGDGAMFVQMRGERVKVHVEDERERAAHQVAGTRSGGKRLLTAVMPGIVVQVGVKEGDLVEAGQTLLVLEAMKMQNPLQAEEPGLVTRVHCRQGDAVAGGVLLVELDPVP